MRLAVLRTTDWCAVYARATCFTDDVISLRLVWSGLVSSCFLLFVLRGAPSFFLTGPYIRLRVSLISPCAVVVATAARTAVPTAIKYRRRNTNTFNAHIADTFETKT